MSSFARDYDFVLPPDRIAQSPAEPRDAARLLHVRADGFDDRTIRDLPRLLRPGDLLVANDTKVIPAQLEARCRNAAIGVTLDRPAGDGAWHALIRNARRLRPGDTLAFAGDTALTAEILTLDHGFATLRFSLDGTEFRAAIEGAGALALPPYISRAEPRARDRTDYQTIFARNEGAVAAPTAGLHFTQDLLAALDEAGIGRATLTLHVGAGTFLPMRGETLDSHRMHAERGELSAALAEQINRTRERGGRIVAVGTTVLRLLETATGADRVTKPFWGETDIFIRPGFRFACADLLVTNFHLPRSTLFVLVCAFAGMDRMKRAYAHAIDAGYRFFSYGDACLLERA